MNDSIDAVMDGEEDEEESQDIMNQVLDEIGIDINAQVRSNALLSRLICVSWHPLAKARRPQMPSATMKPMKRQMSFWLASPGSKNDVK